MNKATKTKAMAGIRSFLERRGFEIVEDGWKSGKLHVDFIARDEDDLVFVDCKLYEGAEGGFPRTSRIAPSTRRPQPPTWQATTASSP